MKDELRQQAEKLVGEACVRIDSIAGGDIGASFKLDFPSASYFMKVYDKPEGHEMMQSEHFCLEALHKLLPENTPLPKSLPIGSGRPVLILPYYVGMPPSENLWSELAAVLAKLHRNTADRFGFDRSTYLATWSQPNVLTSNWAEFLFKQQWRPLLNEVTTDKALKDSYEELSKLIPKLVPEESPSFLHGDLWSGNVIFTETHPILIDPACYYGHRETDLAMLQLFGNVPEPFFSAYHQHYPLQKGWRDRVELFQIYPLLIHAKLFGASYLRQANSIVKRYI